jgi:hypothetical protein
MLNTRLSLLFGIAVGGLLWSTGCVVPQPRGQGLYQCLQEPTTKAWYHLYLPADYVRNQGRHPDPKVKRWPLVMSFHGMKPWDSATAQEREWEYEADNYGYIVCAPELATSDSFMEYPLTREHSYVLRDKQNVAAIMQHVYATTLADPERVLSTSWSCGGYLAHYFPNRFPGKFACIATRLSNFSPKLLIDETVPQYRDKTAVVLFIGTGDLPACKAESEEAVAWYAARKFRVVRGKMIDNMSHQRIPQTAAAFFAEQLGIEPLHPVEAAQSLARVQMTDYYPPQELIAKMSPRVPITDLGGAIASARPTPGSTRRELPPAVPPSHTVAYESTTAGRNYPANRMPSYDPAPPPDAGRPPREAPASVPPTGAGATRVAAATPPRSNWLDPVGSGAPNGATPDAGRPSPDAGPPKGPVAPPARPAEPPPPPAPTGGSAAKPLPATPVAGAKTSAPNAAQPHPNVAAPRVSAPRTGGSSGGNTARRVNVRLSGPAIGTAPHYIAYRVDLPRDVLDGADCLWMDNGEWIGDESSGVKILESPGQHSITILVVTRDNIEYRGSATVYVLERGPASASAGAPYGSGARQ